MSSSNHSQHDALIHTVAERYRDDGYEVEVEPTANEVPFDLGGYQPDIIARRGGLTTIVEVKSQARNLSFDKLRSLAEEVRRHDGWRFVLITGQDAIAPDLPSQEEDDFSWDNVRLRIGEGQRLADSGEHAAGYLILWIALEQMMRFRARAIALPVERLAPAVLIRQLYSNGELNIPQFEAALRCQAVRNKIVHGFHVANVENAARELIDLIKELLKEWSTQAGNDES